MPQSKKLSTNPVTVTRALYDDLTLSLTESMNKLREADIDMDKEAAKERSNLIRAHHRALMALLDCDSRLRKKLTKTFGDSFDGTKLDLSAAKAELHRRLARLYTAHNPET